MNVFLKPVIDEFKYLEENSININYNSQIYKFRLCLTHFSADAPAKASIMCMLQYNAYTGCSVCCHPGKLVPNKKSGSTVRYISPHDIYGLRDSVRTLEIMMSFLEKNNQVENAFSH